MARVQTMVQLSDELLADLDQVAVKRGISRSALIRELLEGSLAPGRLDAIGDAIVAGYQRVPAGEPDDWGALDHQADAAATELMQRLAAEEEAAGFGPW